MPTRFLSPLRAATLLAWLTAQALGAPACGEDGASRPPACAPQCLDRACGDDGCGGSCGACDDGATCSDAGQCVATAPPDDCAKSCDELGYVCGDHCGTTCGTCAGAQDACVDHACVCPPSCGVDSCEQPDGCGASCADCPRDVSCTDCPMALRVVDRKVVAGAVREVTVALDFQPADGAPLPGLADLRFRLRGDAELTQVATGEALLAAHKGFADDPETGRPFRVMGDGTLQLLVLSTASNDPIPAGRWLFLTFRLGAPYGALEHAFAFELALVEREAIFAPPPADAALWGATLGTPLVVWTDDVEVNDVP